MYNSLHTYHSAPDAEGFSISSFATRRPYSAVAEGNLGRTGLSKECTFFVTVLQNGLVSDSQRSTC